MGERDKDKEVLRNVHSIKRLLANYLFKLNYHGDALWLLREVYQEAVDAFGRVAPETMQAMESLAANLNTIGAVEEALKLFLELEKLHSKIYGKENIYTIITHANIAYTLSGIKNRLVEAIKRLHELLGVANRVLGPDHHVTMSVKQNLGGLQNRLRMEHCGWFC